MNTQRAKCHCRFSISQESSNMKRVKISQQNLVVFATPRVIRSLSYIFDICFSSSFQRLQWTMGT